MAVPKIEGSQYDFSGGEVDETLKRAEAHPARKTGARQMVNMRILNSGAVQNRPGRSALFPLLPSTKRTEEIILASSGVNTTFKLAFGNNALQIFSATGSLLVNFTKQGSGIPLPWITTNTNSIRFAVYSPFFVICFPGMKPQVVTWAGGSSFSIADFAEAVIATGQKRTFFYRLSPQNVTMQPSATTGNITVTFSSPIAVSGMTGTRVRFVNRQILLGSLISASAMNATVIEPLPPGVQLGLSASNGVFALGDEIIGSASGAKGIVTQSTLSQYLFVSTSGIFNVGDNVTGSPSGGAGVVISGGGPGSLTVVVSVSTPFAAGDTITDSSSGANGFVSSVSSANLIVQLLANSSGNLPIFTTSDTIVGPSGQGTVNAVTVTSPQAVTIWDDEVMNAFRGYPSSVFVDQFRIGFCNFPQVPQGIGWSAINSPTDLYVDVTGDNAIFELTPDKVTVQDVVPGPESSEFVFCDRKIYYIPITATNPLVPGSVSFPLLSDDGAANVQPRGAGELIVYAGAGGRSMRAVIATGAYLRPFNTRNISEFHTHLFTGGITCIAAPTADSTFAERYIYVLKADGTVAVGKYVVGSIEKGEIVGWGPWTSTAVITWISALNSDVLFTSVYPLNAVCEIVDDTQYLDGAVFVNNLPAAFTPPVGFGPLFNIAPNQQVVLIDLGTRVMGTYQVDAAGHIVPQNNAGENLASSQLVAGLGWTAMLEPFSPTMAPGQSVKQRLRKRRSSWWAAYVSNSTGFLMARLFAGPIYPGGPALGAVMNSYRVTAWNQGDDPTQPPPLREGVFSCRPLGKDYDLRRAIIKDTPGPLLIHENAMEVTP